MHIRPRGTNLSLERSVYHPAVRDDAGGLVRNARHSTEYLGSIPAYSRWASLPTELLDKLKPEEQEQLRAALARNEPAPDRTLTALPDTLARAGRELVAAAERDKTSEGLARLKQLLKEHEAAWAEYLRAAQTAGLRRTVRRKPAAPTAE